MKRRAASFRRRADDLVHRHLASAIAVAGAEDEAVIVEGLETAVQIPERRQRATFSRFASVICVLGSVLPTLLQQAGARLANGAAC